MVDLLDQLGTTVRRISACHPLIPPAQHDDAEGNRILHLALLPFSDIITVASVSGSK
jgi:hypothetical protein